MLFRGAPWTTLRITTDAVLLYAAAAAAAFGAPADLAGEHQGLVWAFPPITVAVLAIAGLYKDRIQARIIDDLGRVLAATAVAAIALIAAIALVDESADPAQLLARAWLFGAVYIAGGRILLAWAQRRARLSRLIAKPALIVGAGVVGARVERRLNTQPELGLVAVGYLDADPPPSDMVPDRQAPILGAPEDLRRVAAETQAEHVVLSFTTAPDRLLLPLIRECESNSLSVSVVPRLFDSLNVRFALEHLGGLPLLGLHSIDPKGWRFTIKHVIDRVGAAVLLLLTLPIVVLTAILVRLSSPGPILYRQHRIGRDGREFEILKFRSMRVPNDDGDASASNVVRLPADTGPGGVEGVDRRTPMGTFMRRTSIDELPQLVNVLKGDMSLVGPRPERPEFVDMFEERIERYEDRHRVKSGVTGWAQVHGLRGQTSLRDRVEWDNYYIENWSLLLDFKILLLTVGAILTGSRDA